MKTEVICRQPNGLAKVVRTAAIAENSSTVKFTFAKVGVLNAQVQSEFLILTFNRSTSRCTSNPSLGLFFTAYAVVMFDYFQGSR
jgi:hypothetical protein